MRATGTISRLTLSAALVITAVGASAVPALAASFTVNRTSNISDPAPGDGACDTDLSAGGRQCTLRAAIETANATPGQDVIRFAFSGKAAKTISVPGNLPAITEAATIDGFTAANTRPNNRATGSNAKLRIILKGPASGVVDGLKIRAPSTVKGLVIQRFRDGIYLGPGGEGSHITGNVIGANPAGTSTVAIRRYGIHVDCDSAVTIGGGVRAARNIIAGSRSAGVLLCEDVQGTTVRGNLIGVGSNGTKDLGNVGAGIRGYGTKDVLIGGDAKSAQNVIAHNGIGITLEANDGSQSRGVRILGNSFFRNARLAIDLDDDGVTGNDAAGDPDAGSNSLQNFPVLTEAKNQNGKTRVKGRLAGEVSSTYEIRFFLDGYNEREGSRFLKTISVSTDGTGNVSFNTTVPKQAKGRKLTATATNMTISPAETSEFAASRRIQ